MKRSIFYVVAGDIIGLLLLTLCISLPFPDSCFSADDSPKQKQEQVEKKVPEQERPEAQKKLPPQKVSVDFDKAQLSELVLMVSEFTGAAFVFDDDIETPVTWSQRNISKDELIPTFIDVLTSLDYTVSLIEGTNDFWSIKTDPTLSAGALGISSGTYHLNPATT